MRGRIHAKGNRRLFRTGLFLALLSTLLPNALAARECSNDLQIYEDRSAGNTETIATVAEREWQPVTEAEHFLEFISASKNTPVLGLRDSATWLRIRATDPETRFIEVEYPPLDHVTLYYPREGGAGLRDVALQYHEIPGGDRLPYGASGVPHRNIVFRLPEYAIGECLYLRVQSESALVLPVRLWESEDFALHTQNEQLVLGIYYGAISIMLVYNLFLAVSLRNASYLFYVLYIFAYGSYLFIWNGMALRFFWPETPILNSIVNPMAVCMTTSLAVFFTRSFFQGAPLHAPRQSQALIILAWIGVVCALAAPFGFSKYVVRASILLSLAGVFLVLSFALRQVLAGYRPARYFLLAFTVLGAGAMANILRTAGLLPANFFTLGYGLQATSLAEMVLLSFGLADRYRISEDERRVAQAESAAKTMFIARMSHEIRTPLNAMLGATQLLEETRLDIEQNRYVQLLISGGRNLLGVVNDVLDLSRITSGRLSLEQRSFALQPMLQESLRNHEPPARNKGLRITGTFGASLPAFLVGDEFRLSRVIGNLLSNAIKFTNKGAVDLGVYARPPKQKRGNSKVRIRDTRAEDRLKEIPEAELNQNIEWRPGDSAEIVFRVTDTGIGIPADRLSNIFAEFSQADESVTRRFGGTGLGLAISRGILEQMGGSIEVFSKSGKGTTFEVRLTLPVGEAPPEGETKDDDEAEPALFLRGNSPPVTTYIPGAQAGPTANAERADDGVRNEAVAEVGLRILLAEDNDDNQALFYAFLKREPHNIDSVENGLEALQKFQEQDYDVVFMDIQMPVMDGLTAVRRIRQWEANQFAAGLRIRRCPIYALSAHAFREEIDRSLEAGCDGHIAKPLVKRTLLDVLATLSN
ncbi:MAG: ATP-binding protein [bacterium]|nr:ATP-binding protein [bacterium]